MESTDSTPPLGAFFQAGGAHFNAARFCREENVDWSTPCHELRRSEFGTYLEYSPVGFHLPDIRTQVAYALQFIEAHRPVLVRLQELTEYRHLLLQRTITVNVHTYGTFVSLPVELCRQTCDLGIEITVGFRTIPACDPRVELP